jgi:DNA-binding transcriptional ArsR family regulator
MSADVDTLTPGDAQSAMAAPLSEEEVESIAETLRILAEPTRIRLIEALKEGGSVTVGGLAACVRVTQQTVSRQLAVLYRAGIVRRRREGMCVHYELADWTGWWLIDQLASASGTG